MNILQLYLKNKSKTNNEMMPNRKNKINLASFYYYYHYFIKRSTTSESEEGAKNLNYYSLVCWI